MLLERKLENFGFGEEKDDDYNSKDNENYNIYNDADEDMD
jgi:hypothetical protein